MLGRAACSRHSLHNTPGCLDMVIFDEHPITETVAMIVTTAQEHGILLQAAQSWRRLARIKYTHSCAFNGLYTTGGYRCDT